MNLCIRYIICQRSAKLWLHDGVMTQASIQDWTRDDNNPLTKNMSTPLIMKIGGQVKYFELFIERAGTAESASQGVHQADHGSMPNSTRCRWALTKKS